MKLVKSLLFLFAISFYFSVFRNGPVYAACSIELEYLYTMQGPEQPYAVWVVFKNQTATNLEGHQVTFKGLSVSDTIKLDKAAVPSYVVAKLTAYLSTEIHPGDRLSYFDGENIENENLCGAPIISEVETYSVNRNPFLNPPPHLRGQPGWTITTTVSGEVKCTQATNSEETELNFPSEAVCIQAIQNTAKFDIVEPPRSNEKVCQAVTNQDAPYTSLEECTTALEILYKQPGEPGKNPCKEGICKTAFGDISTTPAAFATKILQIATGLAGGIALIFMVTGSIRIITSSGNPQKAAAARDQIVAAVAGLLFIIFSVLILKFIGVSILGGII